MALYDNEFKFHSFKKKALEILPIVIALIIIVLIAFFLINFVQTKAVSLSFKDNPLNVSKVKDASTILVVAVNNVTKETAENVFVEVKAVDFKSISIDKDESKTEKIELLGKGESRTLKFIVSPVEKETILEGSYIIEVKALINGEEFNEKISLEI